LRKGRPAPPLPRSFTYRPEVIVFPAMLAGSLAADAFAGERERRTLETLLATPISDRSLVVDKTIATVWSRSPCPPCGIASSKPGLSGGPLG